MKDGARGRIEWCELRRANDLVLAAWAYGDVVIVWTRHEMSFPVADSVNLRMLER